MAIKERQELRNKLLQELYDIYFSSDGNGKKYSNEDLSKESERKLAYEYLAGKGLIDKKFPGGSNTTFIIQTRGIDLIEST